MPVDLPLVLYRDILLYTVYGFLQWKMIQGNEFVSLLYFCVPKIKWSHLYKFFSIPWMDYLSNRMLAKVTSH